MMSLPISAVRAHSFSTISQPLGKPILPDCRVKNTFVEVNFEDGEDGSPFLPAAARRHSRRTRTAPAELLHAIDLRSGSEAAPWHRNSHLSNESSPGEVDSCEDPGYVSSEASIEDDEYDMLISTPVTRRHCGPTPRHFITQPSFFSNSETEQLKQPGSAPCNQEFVFQVPLQMTHNQGPIAHISSDLPVTITHFRSVCEESCAVVNVQLAIGGGPVAPPAVGALNTKRDYAETRGRVADPMRFRACRTAPRASAPVPAEVPAYVPTSFSMGTVDARDTSFGRGSAELRGVEAECRRVAPLSVCPTACTALTDAILSPPPPKGFPSQMVCCHWKNKGWCRYQRSCRFQHPAHKQGAGGATGIPGRR